MTVKTWSHNGIKYHTTPEFDRWFDTWGPVARTATSLIHFTAWRAWSAALTPEFERMAYGATLGLLEHKPQHPNGV